ncbi:phosphonate metabolism protein/1,5-bisphosphokinase (PRPP-forming) PhnN [Rhodobacter maris]|uniref:Ribose 1,5-bisphosphate phosphokinase PhnN n=1 Tax=Rhodobacter maris TaxID=446682 RepID=A0A285S7D0_9RHOB|nr:phosphonate metabolism protein/1,5-bisphosphokinase (PRPP-forming) PhnN [Rhodobacter maris]SOC03395.1 ribose 1,5-bisphosphokinase [Rhodobacter maris]
MRGRLFALVGPSGAGKDRLLAGLTLARPEIHRARRTITRPAAESEDFESLDAAQFEAERAAGGFALDWSAHGLLYGIRPAELARLAAGGDVIFNGSRAALPACLAAFPDLRVIEIWVSPQVLARRLAARGRESRAEIEARLARAALPLPGGITAHRIVNDGPLAAGIAALLAAVQPESV